MGNNNLIVCPYGAKIRSITEYGFFRKYVKLTAKTQKKLFAYCNIK